jgi:cell cycle arrest protein BUB2
VTSSNLGHSQTRRRPASGRKSGSIGVSGKRSGLDTLLREGPPGGNIAVGLQDLRYLVLSSRVDSDSDGMVRLCERSVLEFPILE